MPTHFSYLLDWDIFVGRDRRRDGGAQFRQKGGSQSLVFPLQQQLRDRGQDVRAERRVGAASDGQV